MAPRKWRGEKEKAEPVFRNSCKSFCSSPESKGPGKEHGNNRCELTNNNSTAPLPFIVMTDLYTGSDRGMIWSMWLFSVPEYYSGQSSYFVPYDQVLSNNKYGRDIQSSQWKLFSGSSAAVKKTVSSINFFIPNPLLKGHPLEWMCSVLSWNHTEWAIVHGKPMFCFSCYFLFCFSYYENGTCVVLIIFIILKQHKQ